MADESSGIWKTLGTILPILFIVWSWFLYNSAEGGKDVISRMRLGEDAIWMFASAFLIYFAFQLMVLSKGGLLEKGFMAFMLTFSVIFLWKFIGVNERLFALPKGGLHEFKEILEGVAGLSIGVTFLYMYNLLKPKS